MLHFATREFSDLFVLFIK